MLLTDKNIVITGASRGIGKATAELCAAEGANLALIARNESLLSEVAHHIQEKHQVSVQIFVGDVTDKARLKEIFTTLRRAKYPIDALINNAGIMQDAVIQMVKDATIEAIYNTNVFGTIYATQLALKSMLKRRKGVIINLSSIIGTNGNKGQSIYGSSKSAIIGFTKSLAKELAPLQIRVNAIAPGFIETDMTKQVMDEYYDKNIAAIGMGRIGKPEDVAKVAVFLASDYSQYVTGQIIGVDGGMIV